MHLLKTNCVFIVSRHFLGMALSNFTLTVSEYCSLEQLPAAFGWHMIGKAVFVTLFGPLIGNSFLNRSDWYFSIHWQPIYLPNWMHNYRFNSWCNAKLSNLYSCSNSVHIFVLFRLVNWISDWFHSCSPRWWHWTENIRNRNSDHKFSGYNARQHKIGHYIIRLDIIFMLSMNIYDEVGFNIWKILKFVGVLHLGYNWISIRMRCTKWTMQSAAHDFVCFR